MAETTSSFQSGSEEKTKPNRPQESPGGAHIVIVPQESPEFGPAAALALLRLLVAEHRKYSSSDKPSGDAA
jgi:hypothetical protein